MTTGPADPASAYRRPDHLGTDQPGPGRIEAELPIDPLRLCVYATIAALSWLLGPFALLALAGLGLVGYARARRRGLKKSKCILRDTRIVLLYLGLLAAAASVGIGLLVSDWIS